MNIVIYDTEYTCWEGSLQRNWSNKNEFKELVQISAIKLNINQENITKIDEFTLYIKPQLNPILSDYFINLTNITQSIIDTKGISFEKAIHIFYNFCKIDNKYIKSYCWGSDLGNDSDIIFENTQYYNINSKNLLYWIKNYHFDIRFIFDTYNINTQKYNSGTIYKIIPDNKKYISSTHNAYWDVTSIYLTINWLQNKYKTNLLNYFT